MNLFERFWSAYPRATGKKKAYEQWRRTLEDGADPESLISAAIAYAGECRLKKLGAAYVKHAATFLGPGRHWAGYLRELDVGDGGEPHSLAYEEVAALWDANMPREGFLSAPEPTRKWKSCLAERIAENPASRDCLDWWLRRFREIDASDFASGRCPGRDGAVWRLELSRLLESEDMLQNLMNGKYRNREIYADGPQFVEVADGGEDGFF